jgi:hypothetical protein
MLKHQMANTRNHVTANIAENNAENNNQDANPLPHPPSTLEQVLAMQAQMLQTMQQTMVTCMLNPMRHRRCEIGLEMFSTPSHQHSLMLCSQWMLITGSSLLRRSCKWCSETTMRRSC